MMPTNMAALAGLQSPGDPSTPSTPADDGSMVELTSSHLDKSECYCKNESPNFKHTNLFIGDSTLGLKSDADEQLLIHIVFQDTVKVHSIKLGEYNRGVDPELNPTRILLFVNRESMGFEDAEAVEPTQVIELTAADLKEDAEPVKLIFVKFQRVRNITMFVEDNAGGEITALGSLKIFGRTLANLNMKEFKRQG
mmetsp:Transcript_3672/g.6804  ORF Transcript_3672/g.6804 Transcript_3672/m.6804 type:complete len:195 (+) Transcript_3672:65-649(+)